MGQQQREETDTLAMTRLVLGMSGADLTGLPGTGEDVPPKTNHEVTVDYLLGEEGSSATAIRT
jgi:hypothetical protein